MADEYQNAEEKFKAVQERMFKIFESKNKDYGNSFLKHDEQGAYMNLLRKWSRIDTIFKHGQITVKDETLEDTLLDLANYCVLTILLLEERRK